VGSPGRKTPVQALPNRRPPPVQPALRARRQPRQRHQWSQPPRQRNRLPRQRSQAPRRRSQRLRQHLPLIFISGANRESFTLPLGLAQFQNFYYTDWPVVMAGAVLTTLPIALVYVFFQRYWVEGIVTTGLK